MSRGSERKACVYCLDTRALRPDQILLRGERFYVAAPRGQLVEGYLAIAPYDCLGSLSLMARQDLDEVTRLQSVCARFYRDVYRVRAPLFYEQGRGGGGATVDPDGDFPIHAHLCGLPLRLELHGYLAERYDARPVSGFHGLREAVAGNPYIYADCGTGSSRRACAYVARTPADRADLERSRVKPMVAHLIGLADRGDWRTYPGDRELGRLIQRFADWRKSEGSRAECLPPLQRQPP